MIKILISFLFYLTSLGALEFPSQQNNKNAAGRWDEYYRNTLNLTKPHYTLSLAQKYFEIDQKIGFAVDLGTGTGRDALFLLQKGWNVLAIDAEPLSIEILLNRTQKEQLDHLEVLVSPFSDMNLPDNIDLINASLSLPFCAPEDFPQCWQKIVDHLSIGGRFSGHFFGDQDEWKSNPSLTFHTEEQLFNLFKENFTIEYLQIEKGLVPTASGEMSYSHIYHIVAKKIK